MARRRIAQEAIQSLVAKKGTKGKSKLESLDVRKGADVRGCRRRLRACGADLVGLIGLFGVWGTCGGTRECGKVSEGEIRRCRADGRRCARPGSRAQMDEDVGVYRIVGEREYSELVQDRLRQGEFVVGDGACKCAGGQK